MVEAAVGVIVFANNVSKACAEEPKVLLEAFGKISAPFKTRMILSTSRAVVVALVSTAVVIVPLVLKKADDVASDPARQCPAA